MIIFSERDWDDLPAYKGTARCGGAGCAARSVVKGGLAQLIFDAAESG
jgi:hypothetical protein